MIEVRFTLTVETDGTAFADDPQELATVVRRVSTYVADYWPGYIGKGSVSDSNGNTVGSWSASDD